MIEFPDKQDKKSASAAPQSEHVLADGKPEAGSRLATSVAVVWMWLVLLGFIFVRVIGSHSFRALHWFGRAH
jgi:hypothetical protein